MFPESLLHPTSELSLHSPPLPLHTITSSKTAKLITCKCVLSVVLGVFCIPPKRYLHIEFKSLVFRASQINGVRHKPSYAPCFPQPNLIPLKDNSVPSLSLWNHILFEEPTRDLQPRRILYCDKPHTEIATSLFLTEGFSLKSLMRILRL